MNKGKVKASKRSKVSKGSNDSTVSPSRIPTSLPTAEPNKLGGDNTRAPPEFESGNPFLPTQPICSCGLLSEAEFADRYKARLRNSLTLSSIEVPSGIIQPVACPQKSLSLLLRFICPSMEIRILSE